MSDDQKGMLSALGPKASFILGLGGGLAVMFTVGFFVMLGLFFSKGAGGFGTPTTTTNQAAVVPTPTQPTAQAPDPVTGTPPKVTDADHSQGPKNAKITFIEFSDIQCPFCGQFEPTVEQIRKEYPNDVRLVYKHFPLDSLHPQARPAAEATECVWEQKGDTGFFTYLHNLFTQQSSLGRDFFISEAKKLGVNEAKFTDCIDSRKYKQKVEDDAQQGLAAGVNGTPGSFINDQVVRGALPYSQIKSIIDGILKK